MNGHTYQALMLTTAGNVFMSGGDIHGFWPDADAFRFAEFCEFRLPPPPGKSEKQAESFPLFAANPEEWFSKLSGTHRGMRLHHTVRPRGPDQKSNVSDRMLAGLVGGGARWLIEAVGEEQSDLWEGFDRLGERNEPDRKIWRNTYLPQGKAPRKEIDEDIAEQSLADTVEAVRAALAAIEVYARDEKYTNFADIFRSAAVSLDAHKAPDGASEMRDRFTNFSSRDSAILSGISEAWVFGGMGSWNDLGGGDRYDQVSQALYDSLNDCISALANSTYRG